MLNLFPLLEGNMVISVNSISMSPLPISFAVKWVSWSETICWKPWWWIRLSVSPLMVIGSMHCLEKREILIRSGYSTKNIMLSLLWWKWYNVTNLPPDRGLITPGNVTIQGSVLVLLLRAGYSLSCGYRQVSLDDRKSMWLSSRITSNPAIITTLDFVQNPLDNDRDDWGK